MANPRQKTARADSIGDNEVRKFVDTPQGQVAVFTDMPKAKDILFDANDSQPDYIGLNFITFTANTATANWVIYKFTYSGSNVTRIQKRENVAWDDRATLF